MSNWVQQSDNESGGLDLFNMEKFAWEISGLLDSRLK